jgi:hypothetical protein
MHTVYYKIIKIETVSVLEYSFLFTSPYNSVQRSLLNARFPINLMIQDHMSVYNRGGKAIKIFNSWIISLLRRHAEVEMPL